MGCGQGKWAELIGRAKVFALRLRGPEAATAASKRPEMGPEAGFTVVRASLGLDI